MLILILVWPQKICRVWSAGRCSGKNQKERYFVKLGMQLDDLT